MKWRVTALACCVLVGACASSSEEAVDPAGGNGPIPGTSTWTTLAEMPTPRTEVVGAAARGQIYVVGGFAENAGTVPTVEIYSVPDDSWSAGPDLPIAVNHAMATARRGKVYVFGGYRGPGIAKPTRKAFVLRKGRWRVLPRMPYPVAAGAALTARGKIYIVGGVKKLDRSAGHVLSPRTLVYNPKTRSWRRQPPVPTARQHLGAAASGGKLYVVGGRVQGLEANLATAERFNAATRRWRALPDMPTARGGLAAAATSSGLVVAIGGEEGSGTFEEVEAFDISEATWSSLEPLPTPRHGLAVVAIGDVIYALGGGPQPGLTYSGVNEVLDLGGP